MVRIMLAYIHKIYIYTKLILSQTTFITDKKMNENVSNFFFLLF